MTPTHGRFSAAARVRPPRSPGPRQRAGAPRRALPGPGPRSPGNASAPGLLPTWRPDPRTREPSAPSPPRAAQNLREDGERRAHARRQGRAEMDAAAPRPRDALPVCCRRKERKERARSRSRRRRRRLGRHQRRRAAAEGTRASVPSASSVSAAPRAGWGRAGGPVVGPAGQRPGAPGPRWGRGWRSGARCGPAAKPRGPAWVWEAGFRSLMWGRR